MSADGDALETTIRTALERWSNDEMPDEISVWPHVAVQFQEPSRGRENIRRAAPWKTMRRAVGAALVCVLLAVTGITAAANASPAVRNALHYVWPFDSGPVNQGYSPTGAPLSMKPVPHFRVFYPTHIPSSLGVHGVGHVLPGGLENRSPSPFGLSYNCPKSAPARACASATTAVWKEFPPAPSGPAFFPAVVSSVSKRGIEDVWFGFHAPLPGKAYVSMGEWRDTAYPAPLTGHVVTINGRPARVQHSRNLLRVSLRIAGTAIVVETNLDQARTERLLASLQRREMTPNR